MVQYLYDDLQWLGSFIDNCCIFNSREKKTKYEKAISIIRSGAACSPNLPGPVGTGGKIDQ